MKPWMWPVAAGVALGFAYTLSPLTIVAIALLVPVWQSVSRDITGAERRWLLTIVLVAVALRGISMAGLFLTADPNIPYNNFFGDEEFFKRKTTWLRNVAIGIPISTADFIYAFDKTGDNGYVSMLTYVQALVGLAPYGIHILNASLYLAAVLLLYGVTRKAFGGASALVGLALLLFLPSLFFWSISALKEPVYFLVAAVNIVAAIAIVRQPHWRGKVFAALVLAVGAYLLQSLREGGLILAVVGSVGGMMLAYLVTRPRLLVAAALVLPLVAAAAISRPQVQDRVWGVFREAAMKHWGHINTPGQAYKLMDASFYVDRKSVAEMTAGDAAGYSVRALWSFATVPLPWTIESRSMLAYLPEQMVWYVLLVLTPIGAVAAFKADALVGALLVSHGSMAALMVALSGGNVGTLVRHRGLAMPYLAWLAGLGLVTVGVRLLSRQRRALSTDPQPPDPSKAGFAWLS